MTMFKQYHYDVFISHAVEDKMAIATALREALTARGIKVWYSSTELSVGDRLIETIYKGLDECRFGVVIISPTYLSKIWALGEFFFFLTRDPKGSKVILPVLHDITPEELAARYPPMADFMALRGSMGVDHVADKLCEVIRRDTKTPSSQNPETVFQRIKENVTGIVTRRVATVAVILFVILSSLYGLSALTGNKPSPAFVSAIVEKRVKEMQQKADAERMKIVSKRGGEVHGDTIKQVYSDFRDATSYYRNEYTLVAHTNVIRSKKNVDKALDMDISTMTPLNHFLFEQPSIYRVPRSLNETDRVEEYLFYNQLPALPRVVKEWQDSLYYVEVQYDQPIRTVSTILTFPSSPSDTKKQQVVFIGLHPTETFVLRNINSQWQVEEVKH